MQASRPATFGSVAARAGLASAEIVGFAALAHAKADGHLPPTGQLFCLGGAVFAGALLMLLGRMRVWTLAGLLTLAQVGLHSYFAALSSPVTNLSEHHAPEMHAANAMHAGVMPSHGMVLAHALTAVVTVLVLLLQEQAVRLLAGLSSFPFIVVARWKGLAGPVVVRRPSRINLVGLAPTRGPPRRSPAITS